MSFMKFAFADLTQGSATAPLPDAPSRSCARKTSPVSWNGRETPTFTRLLIEIRRSPAFRLRRVSS